ncbi:mannose-1-phosphate guanylyltransferase/mannose-6-phosphate isomerase [Magnetospirillum sp. 15-1]|uniref:mannose-1-phosphate guanylyltransferase/mannose-6-phosphate isomerase n=1 Tax=Magnetospirillum sp. 15-1 TaxID=1979370 RepID=UPI000BBC0DCD|nr:mannose-1-phosphate guanylyltransferase/mannose-6-phosphate isomerase [Magnetospirillum sp. 15-1]
MTQAGKADAGPAIVPVILSGGAGTRLWPLSREKFPKQLQNLTSELSLLQETALRAQAVPGTGAPIIVCNQEHRFIVAEQMREIGIEPRAIVVEPLGRNTAAAAAVAALVLEAEPDALLLVMPSDHTVRKPEGFVGAVRIAVPLARAGHLVTFGIVPDSPATGYGYIHRGASIAGHDGAHMVDRFVEKPDLATAQAFLATGAYSWNSGIFMFSSAAILAEMGRLRPDILDGSRAALAQGATDLFFFRLDEAAFAAVPSLSIDYAVMEHTAKAAVVPAEMGWSDLGSWSALWAELEQDADGNVIRGDAFAHDSKGCLLRSDGPLVAALGLEDMIVVATGDVVMVADKSRDQEVKALVDDLKARGRDEAVQPARVYRPWGWFETIDEGPRFRCKHILVKPDSKLSLQKHWHRSEHWIVVTGTALVTCGDKTFLLRENESTFIPSGTPHRLENPGKIPLRMIEVQSGEYVGEDDIVRFEDDYGRTA